MLCSRLISRRSSASRSRFTATNGAAVGSRIDLPDRALSAAFTSLVLGGVVTECDLIAKGSVGGAPRGWKRLASGLFQDDHGNTIDDVSLRALAATEGPVTYTCARRDRAHGWASTATRTRYSTE
jgi:hypothetical protein